MSGITLVLLVPLLALLAAIPAIRLLLVPALTAVPVAGPRPTGRLAGSLGRSDRSPRPTVTLGSVQSEPSPRRPDDHTSVLIETAAHESTLSHPRFPTPSNGTCQISHEHRRC